MAKTKEKSDIILVEGVEYTSEQAKQSILDAKEYLEKCEANGRGQQASVKAVSNRLKALEEAFKK